MLVRYHEFWQPQVISNQSLTLVTVTAGFLTGGSLAIRGGLKAARNSAIGCGILLAVIEGVGIGFQRMFAGNTKLEAPLPPPAPDQGQGRPAVA